MRMRCKKVAFAAMVVLGMGSMATAEAQLWGGGLPVSQSPIAVNVGSSVMLWSDDQCEQVPTRGGTRRACRFIKTHVRVECYGGEDGGVMGGNAWKEVDWVYCLGPAFVDVTYRQDDPNCPGCIYQPQKQETFNLKAGQLCDTGKYDHFQIQIASSGNIDSVSIHGVRQSACVAR